jgi:carboxyl-terminal processing protease
MTFSPPWFRRLSLLASCTLAAVVAGCGSDGGGGGGGPAADACSETARKQWVLDVTREWYLFPELLPATVDLAAYATAEELLDALTATARAEGKDRYFSYLTTKAEEESLLGEGQFVGFGLRSRTDPGNRPFIVDVFENSPAIEAGLLRGDEVTAVDQGSGFVPVAELLAGGASFTDLLGPATDGVQRGLRLSRNGASVEVQMTKRTVTIDPVPDTYGTRVLPLAGTTGVGYLHLRTYVSTADPQLRSAFAAFRAQDIRDFVVDLRYNGGGLVSISELVNNLLGGDRGALDVQYSTVHRSSKANQDSITRFRAVPEATRPVRIAFLTTDGTASASEINVNSMKSWVEVAIVGADTYGKPVGQLAFDLGGTCPDRLRLVTFKTVNAQGEGDYYDGLASSMAFACAADDTLAAPLGDAADSLTDAALQWIGTGACGSVIGAMAGRAKTAAPPPAMPLSRPASAAERWLPGIH